MNTINAAVQRVKDFFTPSVSTLVGVVGAFEAQIERTIALGERKLRGLAAAAKSIEAARAATDRDVNAAYKLLHKTSELTR